MGDDNISADTDSAEECRIHLSRLLGCRTIPGSREEVIRFSTRIGELVDLNGEAWVRQNAEQLLSQWKTALELVKRDHQT